MGKFYCSCGHQFSNVLCPTPGCYKMLSDSRAFNAAVGKDADAANDSDMEIWPCPNCGAVCIFWHEKLLKYACYKPEDVYAKNTAILRASEDCPEDEDDS